MIDDWGKFFGFERFLSKENKHDKEQGNAQLHQIIGFFIYDIESKTSVKRYPSRKRENICQIKEIEFFTKVKVKKKVIECDGQYCTEIVDIFIILYWAIILHATVCKFHRKSYSPILTLDRSLLFLQV